MSKSSCASPSTNGTATYTRKDVAVPTANGKTYYVTPTGVKLGSKGKVQPINAVYANLVKSQRRQLRKALRAVGLTWHSAQMAS